MRPAMHHLSSSVIRADALFVSALQRGDHPSAQEVRQAVAAAVEAFGQRGCAGRVAQEFGDHPETAVTRMRSGSPGCWQNVRRTGIGISRCPYARPAHRSSHQPRCVNHRGPRRGEFHTRTAAIAKPTPGNVPAKGHPHLHEHGLGPRVSDMQDRYLTRQCWRSTQVVRSWGSTS